MCFATRISTAAFMRKTLIGARDLGRRRAEPDRILGMRQPTPSRTSRLARAFDGLSLTSRRSSSPSGFRPRSGGWSKAAPMTGHIGDRRPLRYGDMLCWCGGAATRSTPVIPGAEARQHSGRRRDRLKLTKHIAIIDLMNLAMRYCCRRTILALAVALKARCSVFQTTTCSTGVAAQGSLREALNHHAAADNNQGRAEPSGKMRAPFCHETPFAFYAWLLGGDGGRKRILGRLGHEATTRSTNFWSLPLA